MLDEKQPNNLEQSIYKTLVYFSLFNHPLTALEIWKWLYKPEGEYCLGSLMVTLAESEWLGERVSTKKGLYFLQGRGWQTEERHRKSLDAIRKYRRARRSMRWLGRLPGVRGVAVCNTLAINSTHPESDIDLFIITKPGHMWRTRFLAVAPYALLRLRPGEATHDSFCFSFFSSSESLDFTKYLLRDDIYFRYWIKTIVPLYSDNFDFDSLIHENEWADKDVPNGYGMHAADERQYRSRLKMPDLFFFFEKLFRFIQKRNFSPEIADLVNKDTRVIVSDDMLKFHENDRRAKFRDKFNEILFNTR